MAPTPRLTTRTGSTEPAADTAEAAAKAKQVRAMSFMGMALERDEWRGGHGSRLWVVGCGLPSCVAAIAGTQHATDAAVSGRSGRGASAVYRSSMASMAAKRQEGRRALINRGRDWPVPPAPGSELHQGLTAGLLRPLAVTNCRLRPER